MSGKRIVHVSPALFGKGGLIGGGERYVLELCRVMAERADVKLISFAREGRRERLGRLEIEVLPNWAPFGRFLVDPINPALFARLREADIIHYHQTNTTMSGLALIWAHAAGKPIFTTNLGVGGIKLHRRLGIDHWYAGHLHISEFSRNIYGHGGDPRATVILGGVDAERFTPDPDVQRTGEVLFVGRLLPHKGINYLIEAVDAATPLTIIGTRWWRRQQGFYELLEQLMAGKAVSIVETADDQALLAAYRRALCIVLPSVYTAVTGEHYVVPELLGQTLLEGMACGVPAICTDVGAMPEVVEDGVTGFVVPPNDSAALGEKIAWLKAHPEAARRMGEAGRRRVLEVFSWNSVADRCLKAYGLA